MRDVAGTAADGASPAPGAPALLTVEVPGEGYHRGLISCQAACPVHTDARGYVRAIAEGRFEDAYLIARGPNPFASICGRVCGAPCEAACRRGKVPRVDDDGTFVANDRPISIRALKRFVCSLAGPEARMPAAVLDDVRRFVPEVCADADEMAALLKGAIDGRIPRAAGQKVAIIGAGPAGLSAAHDLALLGFTPVVYETEPVAAGMLAVGVPAYRLPRELIRREVAVIEALGVEIRCGVTVGKDVSFDELRRTHAAVLIAVGAKRSRALGLPGENGPGVLGGVDLLRAVSLGEPLPLGRDVVVVGGGNVAYDVARSVLRQIAWDTARTAARLPGTSRVRLVSLEGLEEMPADTVEILEGDEEGIERLNGWGPDRDRARRCRRRHGGHVPAVRARLRREPALRARLRRRRSGRPSRPTASSSRSDRRRTSRSSPRAGRTSRRCAPAGRRSTPSRSRRRRRGCSSPATSRTARAS